MDIMEELTQRYPALSGCAQAVTQASEALVEAYRHGGKLLVCGNGGSGADAEHIVGELMKEFYIRRPLSREEQQRLAAVDEAGILLGQHLQGALPAIPLTGSIALSTAYRPGMCCWPSPLPAAPKMFTMPLWPPRPRAWWSLA